MGTFASVSLYDRGSTKPVSGRTVRVTSWPDGGPVETDPAVLTTDYYGATPEFSTIDPDVHAVRITAPASQPRTVSSIETEQAVADAGPFLETAEDRLAELESRSGTSGTVTSVNGIEPDETGNVTINAALPDGGIEGQVLTVTASGAAWAEGTPGPQGPEGPEGPKGDPGDVPLVESSTQPAQTGVLWIDPDADPEGGGGGLEGEGPPEGVVSAPPGAVYTDILGTNGAWRWIKTSGSAATDWAVIYGDTGYRFVPTTNDDEFYADWAAFSIRRVGDVVSLDIEQYVRAWAVVPSETSTIVTLPSGFRPKKNMVAPIIAAGGNWLMRITVGGQLRIQSTDQSPVLPSEYDTMFGAATWLTSDSWPTSLPDPA